MKIEKQNAAGFCFFIQVFRELINILTGKNDVSSVIEYNRNHRMKDNGVKNHEK